MLTQVLNNTSAILNAFTSPNILPSTAVISNLLLKDYYKADIPTNGQGKPGPFQNLTVGTNTFQLWNGLRPLNVYENPNQVALPLNLVDFKGSVKQGKVNLEWLTVNEVNVANFQLEKSLDGKNFVKIYERKANNSKQLSRYTYSEDIRKEDTFYYRLKMNDISGEFSYSNIIFINTNNSLDKINAITNLYPNPVKDKLTIEYQVSKTSTLMLVNTIGQIVYKTVINPVNKSIEVDTRSIDSGIYSIIIKNEDVQLLKKFVRL